jgi:hypothetical protein
MPKTWVEKRNSGKLAHVETTIKRFADIPEGSTMLIATPAMVDEYIKQMPKNTPGSLQQMRKDMAAANNAEFMCPVTAGIFTRIAAEAAYEEFTQGKPLKSITPFWRLMDEKSNTAKKLSFGTEFLIEQRKKEKLP